MQIQVKNKLHYLLFSLALLTSLLIVFFPNFGLSTNKRKSLNQSFDLAKILNNNYSVQILFFGYSGCTEICSPRLHDLAQWYNKQSKNIQSKLQITFLDISQPENKNLPQVFAQSFHKAFQGVYLKKEEMRDYTQTFSVYFSKLQTAQMNHSSHFYIVQKKESKKLRYIYHTYPFDTQQLTQDIKGLLHG